jgi:MFS transporter, SHS family, lactate transporter
MATGRRDGQSELGYEEDQMGVGRYLATRLTTLVPPMNPAPNPIRALALLNRQQWLFFLV